MESTVIRSLPRLTLLGLAAALLAACAAPQPLLYQPAAPTPAAQQRAQADLAHCVAEADARVGRNALKGPPAPARQAAAAGARVAGVAFASAAAAGAAARSREVWQRARGAAAGGVVAVGATLLLDHDAPDAVHKKHVELCLEDRGQRLLGWR